MFQELKTVMTNILVLALLIFTQPCVVETNTLGVGNRDVTLQDERPLTHFSQALHQLHD